MDRALIEALVGVFSKARVAAAQSEAALTESLCWEAWALVPEPKFGWDSSYVVLGRMVSFLRAAKVYEKAISLVHGYLESGHHLDYEDGPYFWLGTLHYEKGNLGDAYTYLDRANRMSGGRCFREEEPKYKAFLKAAKAKNKLR